MKIFMIFSVVSLTVARPEAPGGGGGGGGSGYTYNGPIAPSTSYIAPSSVSSYDPPSTPNGQYGAPSLPSPSYGAPSLPSPSYGAPSLPSPSYGAPPSLAPIIHKHVYVHVPPPEPENIIPIKTINVPPPQKHYKIVFIKAPTAPAPTAPVIPSIPQNEEKTLVYVLVKRPDDQPEVVIPTAAPTVPSKPEVYFIRYKTQKQDGGGGGYPDSGVPKPPISSYGAPAPNPSQEYGAPNG